MKLSIITPSFNYDRYINDCIDSVEAIEDDNFLLGKDFEHIVVDGGSTDRTLELLSVRKRLRWVSEPDKGMSDAINKGFSLATGEWLMWLNADDVLRPERFVSFLQTAMSKSGADVVYGAWNFVDEKGRFLRSSYTMPFDKGTMVYTACYIGSTACLLRRSTTFATGIHLRENFHCAMDQELYLRLDRAGKRFAYIPKAIANFRLHGNNQSMRHRDKDSFDEVHKRSLQLAEGRTIRRIYGRTLCSSDYGNNLIDSILHWYYRLKRVFIKLVSGSYWKK